MSSNFYYMSPHFEELIEKLEEIFQIDKQELDFGIYRILAARRKQIEDFLHNRLAEKVQSAFAGASSPQTEDDVYSHLLTFFSRYYDKGDFISLRRYKGNTYAIPYNGEEVKLHWANADQYYIKSGESFSNYDFSLPSGVKVHFRLLKAEVTKDNAKDNDTARCYVLWDPSAAHGDEGGEDSELPSSPIEEKEGELYIYFQYLRFPKGTKQKEKSDEATSRFLSLLGSDTSLYREFYELGNPAPAGNDKSRTVFRKYLDDFTAKNTSDYFIHKDLKSFLNRELDFYIKNEMLRLDDIQSADAFSQIEIGLRKIQVFRSIASDLIDFMAQLENFQRKLWLKKKFVVQCDYCITMDLVPRELRDEVFSNPRQLEEWEKLNISESSLLPDARMVDTKFFDESFKSRLLRAMEDIDDRCDGVLVHSENYGALKLLASKYHNSIKAVFTDPPYNTGDDGFPYKDQYQTSSWLTMMKDRLEIAAYLLKDSGIFGCHIDEHEHQSLDHLLSEIFMEGNLGPLVWDKRNPKGEVFGLAAQHEYVHFATKDLKTMKSTDSSFVRDKQNAGTMLTKAEQLIKKSKGSMEQAEKEFASWLKSDAAGAFSEGEKAYKYIDQQGNIYRLVSMAAPDKPESRCHTPLNHPVSGLPCPVPAKGWRYTWPRMMELMDDKKIVFGLDETTQPQRKYLLKENLMEAMPSVYYMGGSDDALMKGMGLSFKNPKTVKGSEYFLKAMARPADSIITDFFAGSGTTGHAVISLNRKDGGRRRYILIEMGEHFHTVLLPRLKKIVYSPTWKDGKPTAADKGISHCIKYMKLESYEDTLNNLELEENGGKLSGELRLQDEYLLRYMLDIESRGSLIDTDTFQHPFDYSLKIAVDSSGASEPHKIDLVETFNYLIGIHVVSQDRRIEKGYVMVEGRERGGAKVLIVWRDCDKINNDALNELLEKKRIRPGDSEFDLIYVNGDHNIASRRLGRDEMKELKVRSLEEEFLTRMFEET